MKVRRGLGQRRKTEEWERVIEGELDQNILYRYMKLSKKKF